MTPQLRSRKDLTDRGYLVSTVEQSKRFPDRKKKPCNCCKRPYLIEVKVDMWNIFDLVAVHPQYEREIVFVQVTGDSGGNHAARRNKILGSMEAKLVLLSGAKILIQSWKKVNNRFQVREEWIRLKDYAQANYPDTVAELVEIRRKEKLDDLPPGTTIPFAPILDADIPF